MSDYKIYANHAHLFPKNTKPNADIDKLKELMDACNIEKAVCFAPFQNQMDMYDVSRGQNPNDWIAEEIKNEPKLVAFGSINFEKDNLEEQVKHIAELGLLGIKIHPAYQEVKIDSPELFRVYEAAEKENLFISFHTGLHWHRIADYSMLLFDEVAFNFPRLRFSMEHMGGYSFFREALLIMNNNSRNDVLNTFAGWTSIGMEVDDMGNARQGAWSLTDDDLCTLVHQAGYESSIFGLDFPYKKADDINKAINRIKNLQITEEAKKAILGGNLKRELNL
jgi:predicted TIM-barrel fold metal-dependent hydrolase